MLYGKNNWILSSGKLEEHSYWMELDSTKILNFKRCPRLSLFKDVMGIVPTKPDKNLVFGTGMHDGMKILNETGYTQEAVEKAKLAFRRRYYANFTPESEQFNSPKIPKYADVLFDLQIAQYSAQQSFYETLAVETVDTVALDPDCKYNITVKLDLLLRNRQSREVIPLDYKTSGTQQGSIYHRVFGRSTQFINYMHAARVYFGYDTVNKFVVHLFIVLTKSQSIHQMPLVFSDQTLAIWYRDMIATIDSIHANYDLLLKTWDQQVLPVFFPRETSCTNFGKLCDYYDYCAAYTNPLTCNIHNDRDFKIEFWSPRDGDTNDE